MKTNVCIIEGNFYQSQKLKKNILSKIDYIDIQYVENNIKYLDILEKIQIPNLFGIKVVVIKCFSFDKKKLTNLIDKIDENVFVMFYNVGIHSRTLQSLKKQVKVFEYDKKIKINDIDGLANSFFENKNISFSFVEIAENLFPIEKRMADIDLVFLLFQKIKYFIGKRKEIKKIDVEKLFNNCDDFIVWTLVDSLCEKKYEKATAIFEKHLMYVGNTDSFLEQLVKTLIWKFRLLMYLKNIKSDDKFPKEEMSKLKKTEKSGKDFYAIIKIKEDNSYGENIITNTLEPYCGKSSLENFKLPKLVFIYEVVCKLQLLIRDNKIDSEYKKYMFNMLFCYICGKINKIKLGNV